MLSSELSDLASIHYPRLFELIMTSSVSVQRRGCTVSSDLDFRHWALTVGAGSSRCIPWNHEAYCEWQRKEWAAGRLHVLDE